MLWGIGGLIAYKMLFKNKELGLVETFSSVLASPISETGTSVPVSAAETNTNAEIQAIPANPIYNPSLAKGALQVVLDGRLAQRLGGGATGFSDKGGAINWIYNGWVVSAPEFTSVLQGVAGAISSADLTKQNIFYAVA